MPHKKSLLHVFVAVLWFILQYEIGVNMKSKRNIVIIISCLLNIFLIIILVLKSMALMMPTPLLETQTSEDTLKNTLEKYNEYYYSDLMDNPIDQAYLQRVTKNISEIEYKDLQTKYEEIWKEEYEKALKILKDKAVYQEDKDNINKFNEYVVNFFDDNKTFFETIVLDDYSNPSLPEKNSYGNGTTDKLREIQGKIYRNACMQIISVLPYGEYTYPDDINFSDD